MYCKVCGDKIEEDEIYCDCCGNKIIEKFKFQNQYKKSNKKKQLIISIISIIIVVITIGIIVRPKVWISGKFTIENKKYSLKSKYKKFKKNNWIINENNNFKYNLQSYQKTIGSNILENKNYPNTNIKVGFINNSEEPRKIANCTLWQISVYNISKSESLKFKLPGNIKNNSTYKEISKVYGTLPSDKIDIHKKEKYKVYHYSNNNKLYLDLIVDDKEGLIGFTYMKY